MLACPACKASLTTAARESGRCPRCGLALPKSGADAPAPYAAPVPDDFDLSSVPELELPAPAVGPTVAEAAAPAIPQPLPAKDPSSRREPVASAGGGRDLDEDVFGDAGGLGAPLELDEVKADAAPPSSSPLDSSAVSNPRLPVADLSGVPRPAPSAPAVETEEIDPREARAFAGHEDAPEGFWLWPLYAARVAKRRLQMATDISAMRRAYALAPSGPAAEEQRRRIVVAEAAMSAHDARAYAWGFAIAIGAVTLMIVVLFFPLIYRALVHVEPPRLDAPPPG